MSGWSLETPPNFLKDSVGKPKCVATTRGWEDKDTGELIVAIRGLSYKASEANITLLEWGAASYVIGDPLSVKVRFNEKVDVAAQSTIVVRTNQATQTLTSAASSAGKEALQGDTVTIGSTIYEFKTALTSPAVPYEVKVGADENASFANLVAAINGASGAGTAYGTGTVAHPDVTAVVGTAVAAAGTLSLGANAGNTKVVVLGAKTYTFQTILTDADGHVLIGATALASLTNLIEAITLGSGVGTDYATLTTLHPTVTAAVGTHVAAAGTLTFGANAGNTKIVTIDSKVYTFQDTLTNVDGNVKIGTTANDTLLNLVAAITLGAGAGTKYALLTTLHPTATAAMGTGDTMVATAKTAGAEGNAIVSTTDVVSATWTGGYLVGGLTKLVATAKTAGAPGNLLASTTDVVSASWAAATLAGGQTKAVATAILAGTDGNSIATTETCDTQTSWGNTTLLGGANVTLYALVQDGVTDAVFNKVTGGGSNEVVPAGAGSMSVKAQTLGGTVYDDADKVAAYGTLTLTGVPHNNDTVTINSKEYVFQDELTETDGHVLIGESMDDCIYNLIQAINLGDGAGTLYAEATTLHATVTGVDLTATTMKVVAKTAGSGGNSLTLASSLTHGSWSGSYLANGAETSSSKVISSAIALALTPVVATAA